jgi:ABC-type multidrug transport system permease subunit
MVTILRIAWTNLRRDRFAQALTFLLPIIFFSIFASVFGGQGGGTPRVDVAVVDEDHSDFSDRLLTGLRREGALRMRETRDGEGAQALTRSDAEALVRAGEVPVAVVVPAGMGVGFADHGFAGGGPPLVLLADASDRIAPQMVYGLLQKTTMTAAPDLLVRSGLRQFESHAGTMTAEQRQAVDDWLPRLRQESMAGDPDDGSSPPAMGVGVEVVDVMHTDTRQGNTIAFYAAGIGVMFLLFSSVAGAGGALLDEADSGTLERLLSTRIGMGGVLIGKWLFLTLVGCAQLTVMFLWGRVIFDLPLFAHLPGFAIMTVATAGAASALGLVLATLARTRAQLSGFSTIFILTMSALGGSMFPRFLMPEAMQTLGLFTFNAWALDGYLKVFWRNAPLWQLWPQLGVLLAIALGALTLSRYFARRWEIG